MVFPVLHGVCACKMATVWVLEKVSKLIDLWEDNLPAGGMSQSAANFLFNSHLTHILLLFLIFLLQEIGLT